MRNDQLVTLLVTFRWNGVDSPNYPTHDTDVLHEAGELVVSNRYPELNAEARSGK